MKVSWALLTTGPGGRVPTASPQLLRLQSVGLVSNVDRYVTAPLLVTFTQQFGVSLRSVTFVASGHLVGYGLSQLPWSAVMARRGPVSVMRIAVTGAGAAACLAAIAPGIGWLVLTRVVGGACLGAAVPAALLYAATRLAPARREEGFAAIVSANGLGIAVAVALALVGTSTSAWRLSYLLTGLMLVGCGWFARYLPEQVAPAEVGQQPTEPAAAGPAAPQTGRAGPGAGRVAHAARPVLLVAVEGAIVVGGVIVLPALAESVGAGRAAAAATVALYGLAMPVTGWVLGRVGLAFSTAARVLLGALVLCLVPVAVAVAAPLHALCAGAVLLGVAWSVVHPSLQGAAAQVWPERAPTVLAVFVSGLFLGSAAGSQLLAWVAQGTGLRPFAWWCAAGAIALVLLERLTRRAVALGSRGDAT